MWLLLKSWLPSWPVVPPRLWLTVAIVVLASLNLLFKVEIWPNTPSAAQLLRWMLVLSLMTVVPQLIWVLWHWSAVYGGPWVLGLLFRMAMICVIGLLLLMEVVFIVCAIDFLSPIGR
jgi:hypothetical protein